MQPELSPLGKQELDFNTCNFHSLERLRVLLQAFVEPLGPSSSEKLMALVNRHALKRKGLETEIEKSTLILEHLSRTRERLLHNDAELPDLDISLMRKFFFLSLVGKFRDSKFFRDPQRTQLRPELEMMRRLLEHRYPGRGSAYIRSWTAGLMQDIHELPFRLTEESFDDLSYRLNASLTDAIRLLPVDSVLRRLMTSHKVQHRIERIIVEPTDCEKERLLCSLCNEIMTKPAKYLGKAVFNRLNHNPENLFNFVKLHRNWAPTTHANEATDDKLLLEALTVYAQHNIADRRLHHQPSSALDYNTALDRLGEFLPSWVIRGIEQEPQFLSALLITDLIRHRVRYLNKTYRMMQDLRSLLTTASLPKKASAIRELASDIINSECRSGDLVEKRGGTGHIPRAEFYSHIATIMRKASYIGKARDQEFDAARYEGINVRTTNRLYKLMEGLRSNRQCLSWDFSWGESHYTIPELLFSGTSDSLLLEGPGKRIEASLTVRLMPAIVEGRLEPVLFRQKMRVQGDDDLYRIALNDMAIALAARCGASRIIMASGFIGDPEAHGYQPELYIKDHGILISYKDSQGRKLTERVVLSNRRRISGVELIFVEPEISTADGFHAHDDKQTYRRDSEEILGIQCRTFHDPRDRFSERKQFLPAFWVVDVERRILAIE